MIRYIFIAITWCALFGVAFSPLGSVYCFNKVIKYHGVKPGLDTGRANFENLYSLPFRSVGFNVGSVTDPELELQAKAREWLKESDKQTVQPEKLPASLLRYLMTTNEESQIVGTSFGLDF